MEQEQETWKSIPGFPNYEVSDLGRVRRVASTSCLKSWTTSGYLCVALGFKKNRYVHHIVALVFLGPTPEGQEIRHKDGVKSNCRRDNLEFGTRQDNIDDRRRHGRTLEGDTHPNSKLNSVQVLSIRARYTNGESMGSLAREHNVNIVSVSNIIHRRTWDSI